MALTPNAPQTDNSMQTLKQYGSYIITAMLLALAGYFGWTYWQNNHARVDTVAADQYADIQLLNDSIDLAAQNPDLAAEAQTALAADREQLNERIDSLVATHGDSVYAWQALMIKARTQVDNEDFDGALDSLKQALSIDLGDAGLKAITQLRYARVLLASGDTDAAMAAANNDMPNSFEASQQELMGDIYMAQDDKQSAIQAYNNAWSLLQERNEPRAVLALKLESLGVIPEPIDESDSLIQAPADMPVAAQASGNGSDLDNNNQSETLAQ